MIATNITNTTTDFSSIDDKNSSKMVFNWIFNNFLNYSNMISTACNAICTSKFLRAVQFFQFLHEKSVYTW